MARSCLTAIVEGRSDVRESPAAWFVTPTPWVAPQAYFHVVYKPAPHDALASAAKAWLFPPPLIDLLARNNGARLFSGALSVYGVVPLGQRLNRLEPFSLPPFNIERENESWALDPDHLVVVGGYQLDGSRACVDRRDSRVLVFARGDMQPSASFVSLGAWLECEIERYHGLFDKDGHLTGAPEEVGPPCSRVT